MNSVAPVIARQPATWAVALAFGLIYLSWGTTYLAIKKGVQEERLPPALFGGVRITLAGLLVLGYVRLRGQPLALTRRDLVSAASAGLVLFVGGNGMITQAQTTLPSGVTAVLAATTPVWIAVLGLCWPRGERLTAGGWLGVLLGLAGVAILLWPELEHPQSLLRDIAPLLVLGSAASWALGSLIVRHRGVEGSYLTVAAYQMILGGTCLTLIGLALGEASRLPPPTPGAAFAFFYLLIVGSLIGFIAYNWLLGHVSATQASTYAYVNPIVAVLIAWWDGEEMTLAIVAGITVILIGVALVRGGHNAKPGHRVTKQVELAEVESST
jgi:drug/metabolite transporter (DMT)-like permease